MHLPKVNGFNPQQNLQHVSIRHDMRRVVSHMIAQIKRIKGRLADATFALKPSFRNATAGEHRLDVGRC